MGLLISILDASNHTKCVLLSNKTCMTQTTDFNETKATFKTQNFNILLVFLLITIALLTYLLVFTVIWKNIKQNKKIIILSFQK